MLSELLNHDTVRVRVDCQEWQEAFKAGADLLIRKNYMEERYVDAIICKHKIMGPYMVIAPGIVLSHARPEDGVLQLSMSLITLKNPVVFGNFTNDPVKLLITFGATDPNSHLAALVELMELLMNEGDIGKIMGANSQEEIIHIIRQYPR